MFTTDTLYDRVVRTYKDINPTNTGEWYFVTPTQPFSKWLFELNKAVLQRGGFIAGSYPAYMIAGAEKEPGDIDVFCRSKIAFGMLYEYFKSNFTQTYTSSNAITYSCSRWEKNVQLIQPMTFGNRKTYGESALKVVSSFDFTVCQAFIARETTEKNFQIGASEAFMRDVVARKLVHIYAIVDENEEISSGLVYKNRLMGYVEKGFFPNEKTILKLIPEGWMDVEGPRKTVTRILQKIGTDTPIDKEDLKVLIDIQEEVMLATF